MPILRDPEFLPRVSSRNVITFTGKAIAQLDGKSLDDSFAAYQGEMALKGWWKDIINAEDVLLSNAAAKDSAIKRAAVIDNLRLARAANAFERENASASTPASADCASEFRTNAAVARKNLWVSRIAARQACEIAESKFQNMVASRHIAVSTAAAIRKGAAEHQSEVQKEYISQKPPTPYIPPPISYTEYKVKAARRSRSLGPEEINAKAGTVQNSLLNTLYYQADQYTTEKPC